MWDERGCELYGKMMFFKIQNRSMITSNMDDRLLFFRMQSIQAQTRLKRLRTILPWKGSYFHPRFR
jgi:hypothetical protein